MNFETKDPQLQLPDGMRSKLEKFQRQVWKIKLIEGILGGIFGLGISYLTVFALDRFWETPGAARGLILIVGCLGFAVFFPMMFHRWVWRQRQLEQVARLLRHRFPRLSDQMLGVIELAHSQTEQARSTTLVKAAMSQVDDVAQRHDFAGAVPNPKHRRWAWCTGVVLAIALIAIAIIPDAGSNALARWLLPWMDIERYTFVKLDELPDEMVVPYAEKFNVNAKLAKNTEWSPELAKARYANQEDVTAKLNEGAYRFSLPAQKEEGKLALAVGDARKNIDVKPMTRPELKSMTAKITLPNYLERQAQISHDVRGGSATIVKGSQAIFEGVVSRELKKAAVDGKKIKVDKARLITEPVHVEGNSEHQITWNDIHDLTPKEEAFTLTLKGYEDEAPTLMCDNIRDGMVLLEDEVLSIQVQANDDFGIKQIGMEWNGYKDPVHNPNPVRGEKVVSAGGPEEDDMLATAAFSAKREGIDPQVVQLRIYAVDYLPDRERTYSPNFNLFVLNAEDHAVWLTEQFRKWFRHSQEVYEREQQLYETNKQLRDLPQEEIDNPDTRRQIESQAAAERANGRRLGALTRAGTQLVKQATKNDQFNVATLEKWAEMLQQLKDISDNRMPSVADLLKQAADAQAGQTQPGKPGKPGSGQPQQGKSPPQVGENRNPQAGKGDSEQEPGKVDQTIPKIVDVESGHNKLDEEEKKDQPPSPPSPGKLTLPGTTLVGGPMKEAGDQPPPPAQEKMDEAVKEQKDLLAEFAKVAEELKKILGNLEGSTFVKRLKAASRKQLDVASDVNKTLNSGFGIDQGSAEEDLVQTSKDLAQRELEHSETIYTIQEDMEAYFNRVQEGKFRGVLQEMKNTNVVSEVKQIGEVIEDNFGGQSIAEAEFWSDTLDRWAEQLVGPG